MNRKYVYHTDPGHGWLAVKRNELEKLGILHKISQCSYQKGNTVYLEEDCDASLFYKLKISLGEKVEVRESFTNKRSPIRNYDSFQISDEELKTNS